MEKNVLITGSASGLGHQAVRLFAERGYHVFAGVRRAEDAEKVARLHPAVTPILLDVADPVQVAAAAEQVDRACGPAGLAVLINAAGSILYGPIEYTSRAEAAALFEVLTFGPFELSNRMLPALKRFSSWPTYPQLYINGELVGGCDIVLEMYRNGELRQVLETAGVVTA